MKDPSDETAIRQGSIRKPLREPRSTSSLRNPSSPSLAAFPTSSSSKTAAGADAFDVIVQASNPSHPQHAAWVERYGGSIRNTRKSIDGPSTSYHGESSQPPSLPRSRSRTASKVSTTPNAKSRPALNDVMMVTDASVWTLLANQGDDLGGSDRSQSRRQASAPGRSVEETDFNIAYKEGSRSARLRTGSSDIRSDATVGASSVKTSETDRGQRRRRKKEKGKARAAAPPVPPPRTTSHAAYLEQTQDTLSPITNENAIGEDETSASPPSLPYLSKKSLDASNSPINLSPRLADDPRLRHGNDRMGSIDERSMDVQSPSLLSPTTANAFALRQSSISPELPQGSPASTASSPPPTRTMFANLAHSLPGRRSVDFRLPDDDVMKLRQENAKPQRRGLDVIFSPIRSAVAGRRAEKQVAAAAAAPSPLQSEAKKPLPILRVGTPTRASVDIAQRIAPTPPPRSPLRRTPIIQQDENNRNDEIPNTSNATSHVQEEVTEAPQASTMDKMSASNSEKINKEVVVGTGISLAPQNEAVAEKVRDVPTVETAVQEKAPSSVTRIQSKLSSTPSMQTTNSSDATARSQKTFVSLPRSNTHSRSLSMDTEEGQEFHDAISDEGGLGSSDDAMPSNPSTIKKRRSRHKSIEDVNAARLQAKEAALNEPLPDVNKQIEKTEPDPITRQRRDSSASEDMIPITGRKNSLKRKVSKKQIRTSASKKEIALPSKTISAAKVEQMDDKMVRDQSHRQSAATITNSNIHKREVETSIGDLDGRRKTVTQSSLDGKYDHQPIETNDSVQAIPKELPDIPTADFTPTPASLENGFQRHDFGFSKSQSSRDIADNYRAAQRKAAESGSIDYKQLPLPPPPLPSLPNSPVDINLKKQIAHQRSYSRINQSQSSNNGGKISGVFSRMRKDKTPSFSNLHGSDSQHTSLTDSTSQLNLISPSQSPVQDDRNSGIGLGIDTASMQSSKGTNTSDQHFPSSPSQQQPIRSPTSEGGWRNRLPSFSASRAAKTQKGERSRTESNQQQPTPPIPRQPSNSQMQRQQLLYEAVAQSMSDNSLAHKAVPLSPTIHKTLSPALLREERHEADEVGSFIGSEEAEEERLADSRRGTWNSFSNFELAPNKVYDASVELGNSTSQPPTIDIQGPAMSSIPKSNTTPSNLTSGSFSSPITPQINDPNSYLRPSGSFSPDVMNLSMTARRLSRSSSNPKFQSVPQALDLSPGRSSKVRKQDSPSDGMENESYDDSQMSPFLKNSPAIFNNGEKEAFGSLSFPSSPGQSAITGSGSEAKRSRNLSIGSTLLGNITGNNSNGTGSNTIKPRSSFAMDRDRSPVVNQAWTDLPPSPSPRSSGVRKFFTSAAKSNLRLGKNSNNTFMSPGRPSFQAGSPNDVSFPVSPALPSGQSAMFTDLWKQESPNFRTNGNAHSGMPSSSSFNSTSSYPLAQSASASSLQQATISSQDHSSQQSNSSPITNHLRQAGLPRGMPSTSLHSSTSLNDSLHKEWVTQTNGDSLGGGASGALMNAESVSSNSSSRNITSQRMIDSSSFSQSSSTTNEADLQAFGRMLRESAKEDAQRVREIAQKSVSANNTPQLP